VLAFALNGAATLPAATVIERKVAADLPAAIATAEVVAEGKALYQGYCSRCHGDNAVSGNVIPDVRYATAATHEQWQAIVHDGALSANGMSGFKEWLNADQIAQIQQYVLSRAHAAQ